MNKFYLKVVFGLFISTFFFRLGFCLVIFLLGLILSRINTAYLAVGVAFLAFDLIVSVMETVKCLSVVKDGDDECSKLLYSGLRSNTPYEDIAKLVESLTGIPEWPYDRPGNRYLPLAGELKEALPEDVTVKEAVRIFKEITDAHIKEGENIEYDSLEGTRYSDLKTYYVLHIILYSEGFTLNMNLLFRKSIFTTETASSIMCDGDREKFYSDLMEDHAYLKFKDLVPMHIDIMCGSYDEDELRDLMRKSLQ